MTFAIGVRVAGGVIALADSKIVRGREHVTKAKLAVLRHGGHDLCVMSSGLRSVRDKALVRFEDMLLAAPTPFARLHEVASCYGEILRAVRAEDGAALHTSGLVFDSHTIIGGRLRSDSGPEVFHVYPEGNWTITTEDAPFAVVGRSSYSKALLDQHLTYDTPLPVALTLAIAAFDATRQCAVDVGAPVDVAVAATGAASFVRRRIEPAEVDAMSARLQHLHAHAFAEVATAWAIPLLNTDARYP